MPLPATTELTVWETRGAIWDTTWLTTSLELDWEEEDWLLDRLELLLLEPEELVDGLREAPETAELTVWLTRGLIWLTTLDTMSDWDREDWPLERDPLPEPEEKLEPKPDELEDPKPEEAPKLEEELDPKLEDPELKLDPDPEENPEEDPDDEEELMDDWGLSLIWT